MRRSDARLQPSDERGVLLPGGAGHPIVEVVKLVWHFVIHIFVGTVLFMAIGAAVVALHWFVTWMAAQGVSSYLITVLQGLEYAVFALDTLAYVWFLVRVSWKFLREIAEQTR